MKLTQDDLNAMQEAQSIVIATGQKPGKYCRKNVEAAINELRRKGLDNVLIPVAIEEINDG